MHDLANRRLGTPIVMTLGCLLTLSCLLPVRGQPAAEKAPRPNVVLVMTDDQGYFDLGCHGNPILQTPHLDRLYTQSVRLTDFHVCPLCSPTRAALITGRYASRTGVWATTVGRSLPRAEEVTVADCFAAGGYQTGVFGKWHLGDNYPFRPQDRGFREVLVHGGGGVGQTPDGWGNDYFDDTYDHNGRGEKFSGYCTDVWFDAALAFIRTNRERPFFVYLPTNAPHGPLLVAEKYSKPYLDRGVPASRAKFYGMVANIDENMGRLMDRLDELGLAENTILIFMTDNGTAAGNRGPMRGAKGSPYEGGHRVPCFIRWPARLEGGRDVDRLTAHFDLLPTLLDLCGLEKPEGVALDGTSLAPLLTGRGDLAERTLVVHIQQREDPIRWKSCAVMTERWRLVNGKELFDVEVDPEQKRDVAAANPEVVARLTGAYEAWWDDVFARVDEYSHIVIGSEAENPARLTGFDWCGTGFRIPWNQSHVRSAKFYATGHWKVDVARDGSYEFRLRRWPVEEDRPIEAATARLQIGPIDQTKPIPQGAAEVTFQVELPAGKTKLETRFTEATGKTRGATFVYVKRLP